MKRQLRRLRTREKLRRVGYVSDLFRTSIPFLGTYPGEIRYKGLFELGGPLGKRGRRNCSDLNNKLEPGCKPKNLSSVTNPTRRRSSLEARVLDAGLSRSDFALHIHAVPNLRYEP
ncbi:hypothetical protein K0M31_014235 [Melipona bicolor]|uniref:Uncharacterized protein n=1 Tax=Melipona bicolor TaxID=60889 RepID=A0AA40G862_9HYME|nr:hypothetical protein K0M31_014235 [Melipona bicolor]